MTNLLKPIDMLESFSDIEQQAAHWFLTMQQPEVSAEDKAAFMTWLKTNPNNQSEYFRLRKIWQALPAALTQSQQAETTNIEQTKPAKAKVKNSWIYATAACLTLALLLFKPWNTQLKAEIYLTKAGETRLVTLTDGSTIKLNTQSKVIVQYSDEQRLIDLIKGEAYFVVAKAKARPFVVKHKNYQFTALGTEFLLNVANSIQLVVTEHSVAVSNNHDQQTIVQQAHGLKISQKWQALAPEKIEQLLAWRQQQLIFSKQPLKEVLFELERYIPGNIHLSDASMANEPVTGRFNLAKPDEIINIIADVLELKVYKSKNHDYFLG